MSRNRLDTSCDCGLPLDQSPAGDPMTESEYAAISPGMQRYRGNQGHGWRCAYWRPITCVACGRKYSGWYSADNDLIDSSFLYAFNDEPEGRDEPDGAPRTAAGEIARLRSKLALADRVVEAAGKVVSDMDTFGGLVSDDTYELTRAAVTEYRKA